MPSLATDRRRGAAVDLREHALNGEAVAAAVHAVPQILLGPDDVAFAIDGGRRRPPPRPSRYFASSWFLKSSGFVARRKLHGARRGAAADVRCGASVDLRHHADRWPAGACTDRRGTADTPASRRCRLRCRPYVDAGPRRSPSRYFASSWLRKSSDSSRGGNDTTTPLPPPAVPPPPPPPRRRTGPRRPRRRRRRGDRGLLTWLFMIDETLWPFSSGWSSPTTWPNSCSATLRKSIVPRRARAAVGVPGDARVEHDVGLGADVAPAPVASSPRAPGCRTPCRRCRSRRTRC